MSECSNEAWNNFVMLSDPAACLAGARERAAALANLFMGVANNGGLNHFLEATAEFDAREVVSALRDMAAHLAAAQLDSVLTGLSVPLPPMSQTERWDVLDEHWVESLDDLDTLTAEADAELMSALSRHVARNEAFYLAMAAR